ncbi:type II toxin-antitoxin system RelE/ParE family toxin [Halothiobacillus sp.]|uniref:type II toxin-antitoxin system RelE/ParE family toxin n=1 Tax=Halothiobacillus sp. TaxID=1891311 RepID=UPI003D151B5E
MISPEAQVSINQAIDWYLSEGGKDLAARAAKAFRSAVKSIASDPLLNPPYPDVPGVRRKVMSRFPYLVFYLLDDDKVVVLDVLHAAKKSPRAFP